MVNLFEPAVLLPTLECLTPGEVKHYRTGGQAPFFGRVLAYVYVNGESVQGTLLKEGYARVAYIMNPPYKYLEQFREEERLAKTGKINIWSRVNFVTEGVFNGCLN
jgi:micrococcal nuclease